MKTIALSSRFPQTSRSNIYKVASRLSTKFIGCLVKPSLRPNFVIRVLPPAREGSHRASCECLLIRVTWWIDRSILNSYLGSQREQALNFTIKAESDPCASCCILQRRLAPVTSKFRWRWRTGHRNFGIVLSFVFLHLGKLSHTQFLLLFRERRKMFNFIDRDDLLWLQ